MLPAPAPYHLYYLGHGDSPSVELCQDTDVQNVLPLTRLEAGRQHDEALWVADLSGFLPADAAAEWQFRINRGDGHMVQPEFAACFTTTLRGLWLQDGQLFDYRPAPHVSAARVIKISNFSGSLGTRPLYLYLPRGYDDHPERRYPVLYMHDGQNCFDAWVDDSYAGAWQADLAASLLIRQGLMQECVIVGVSNGHEQRILEYLPPYARHRPPWP